jgi:hypothetical protein
MTELVIVLSDCVLTATGPLLICTVSKFLMHVYVCQICALELVEKK